MISTTNNVYRIVPHGATQWKVQIEVTKKTTFFGFEIGEEKFWDDVMYEWSRWTNTLSVKPYSWIQDYDVIGKRHARFDTENEAEYMIREFLKIDEVEANRRRQQQLEKDTALRRELTISPRIYP